MILRKRHWAGITFVFIVAAVFFYERESTRRLYACIPSNSVVIVEIRRPAGGWAGAAVHPIVQRAAGIVPGEINRITHYSDSKLIQWLASVLAPRQWVAACIPDEVSGQKTWVIASWLGWRSPMVRIALNSVHSPYVRKGESASGRTVWSLSHEQLPGGMRIEFTIKGGILLGRVGEGTPALDSWIDRDTSVNQVLRRMRDAGYPEGRGVPFRLWVDGKVLSKESASWIPEARIDVTSINATSIAGNVTIPAKLMGQDPVASSLSVPVLTALLDDDAMGMFAARMDVLVPLAGVVFGDSGARAFTELFVKYGAEVMTAMIVDSADDVHAGFPQPCIIAVKTRLTSETVNDLPGFLRMLYQEFELPWLSSVMTSGPVPVLSTAGKDTFYVFGEDRSGGIAYTTYEGWVFIASNLRLLEEGLRRVERDGGPKAGVSGLYDGIAGKPGPAYLWLNSGTCHAGSRGSGFQSDTMPFSAWPWIQTLRLTGQSHAWATSTDDQTVISFQAGR